MSKSFKKWFISEYSDENIKDWVHHSERAWCACKKEILKLLKQHQLGVGNYGDSGQIEGIIHRLEVLDKIRKL